MNKLKSMFINRSATLLGLLTLATALLVAGLIMPIMTISTLVFMRHSFSILSGVYDLFREGKYLLFLIIAGFSVVLPLIKISLLYALLLGRLRHNKNLKRTVKLLHDYGRWAMLDVMVVAVLIVAVKLGAIASVKVHDGLYVFSSAVILIMVITHYASAYNQD